MRAWIRGWEPLEPQDPRAYHSQVPRSEFEERLRATLDTSAVAPVQDSPLELARALREAADQLEGRS